MEGTVFAIRVFPAPGGPFNRILCPPATATSTARFTNSWPFISLISHSYSSFFWNSLYEEWGRGTISFCPDKWSKISLRVRAG